MNRLLTPLRLILVLTLVASLASCSVQSRLKKANRKYEAGAYYDASEAYRKIKGRIPKRQRSVRADVNFKMGECYYNLNFAPRAVAAYKQSIAQKYPDSLVYLHLAKSYHMMGNYKEAANNYTIYLQNRPTNREALAGLTGALQGTEMSKVPSRYVISPAKEFNHRRASDFSPMLVGSDGGAIIFTSNRENATSRKASQITGAPHFDLFTSRKSNAGKWEKPVALEGDFNTDDDEGTPSLTADGRTLYFTRCWANEGEIRGGEIYQSVRSGGDWAPAEQVKLFTDSTITVAHPAISPDGNWLYFVSDAPRGFGGKDIWRVEKMESGWGIPENLGAQINTSGNEMFPYMRADGVLFFSSDGHQGFGGLDIYRAEKDTAGLWHVTNMMAPINSSADDFGITFEAGKEDGYFSSNRGQVRKPVDNIYRFEMPPIIYAVLGRVVDEAGEPLSDAIIKLVGNDGTNIKQRVKKDGSYRIELAKGVNYTMLATRRGYLNNSNNLNTFNLAEKSKNFDADFRLLSISKPVTMDNIFYDFGKWTLTESSEKGLQSLVKLLHDNPNIAIEISAHTDMVGSDESNRVLSQRRAQSVVDYLLKAGIAADRLTAKGYGESQPVTVDKALATKYKFLKENDVLSPEFVEALPKEQQETANQINRRTEFKVTKTTYNLY